LLRWALPLWVLLFVAVVEVAAVLAVAAGGL